MKRVVVRVASALLVAAVAASCGLRTPVRPPEDTAPITPGVTEAVRDGNAVVVRWKRAERSADGVRLDDLASFVVERKHEGEEYWQRVGTVDVADQDKIRRRQHFSWRDTDAGAGPVSYRVFAINADRQEGPPTPPATVP